MVAAVKIIVTPEKAEAVQEAVRALLREAGCLQQPTSGTSPYYPGYTVLIYDNVTMPALVCDNAVLAGARLALRLP